MDALPYAVHRSIVVVDVEKFGDQSRTNAHQVAVRDGLFRSLRWSFTRSGVPWERCRCEDRGDGALVLIPPDVPKNLLAGPLPLELVAALEEHNAVCEQQARIRLRAVLHAGEVRLDAYGAAGAAINLAFRLLESAALRSVLARSPDVLALMASEWFFQEVIRHEPASGPAAFRPVPVSVKETETTAWVCLPRPADRGRDVLPPAAAWRDPATVGDGGPVVVGNIPQLPPVSHPDYLSRLNMLYRALMLQYDKMEEPSVLDRAVEVARDLAGTAPADHPDRGKYLSHLSGALREAFLRGDGNSVQNLQESTEFAKQAAASTPPNHPDRAAGLASLSDLLRLLFDRTHDPVSLRELITTNSTIAKMSGASAIQRITAAQQAAHADLQTGRWRHAMDMIRLATELLPQLGLRDVDRADREHRVSAAHKLPATAAATAIAAGRHEHAVELLEQTRGVVFAGTLDTREDADELRRTASDLLPRFQRIREEINAADHEITLPSFGEHRDATGRHPRELAARRAALNQQWDELLEEIRQRPGLAGFQRPTAIADLCRHIGQDPVVYIVVDESRAHALIVRDDPGGPVTTVNLPAAVTRAAALRQADELRVAQRVATDGEQPVRARRDAQQRILQVLAWTWNNITEPVLRRLGRTAPPADGDSWPRVWWCPVGAVTMLPLHAAGQHGPPPCADTVMSRVVSSYTPTIRALVHARRDSQGEGSALVVAVPDAPESAPLDGAAREAALVREFIPETAVLPAVGGGTVGRSDVIEALRRHGIVHLACHGYANLDDPASSRLLLHDHLTDPLTLHAITRLNLRHAQLAYLSACSTTDTHQRQADEATHLTAAFQLAGYRSVIGTLWPINDQAAIAVAGDFYDDITAHGTKPPDPGRAAQALHHAVRKLRDTAPTLPSRWAAYIHSGA
jgi:hypothetical protein